MLERAVTYKNNGQINIILNGQKQVLANSEAEAEYQAALQKNEAKHSILKEIEREMNTLVGMEEMKRNIKEIPERGKRPLPGSSAGFFTK